jgi:hypothetical protein
MSLRSQKMIHNPNAFRARDCHLPQTIWRGRVFRPENGVMTAPDRSDENRELMPCEHWMSSVVRPISERVLLPTVMRTPGTKDRHQEESETQELRLDAMRATSKNANRAMDLITMPSALPSCFLLAQESRQKQVVIRHRGR